MAVIAKAKLVLRSVSHSLSYFCRQRRREEDFRRTVGNYRTTVETLKLEKQSLLEIQAGGEGEKHNLIASSQKALAKAAQLVADAAATRKREALAVMDKIDNQTYHHLSARLEMLLPQQSVHVEVAAIKGELLTAKVVSKASQALAAISKSFGDSQLVRPPLPSEQSVGPADFSTFSLPDDTKTDLVAIFHQTEFAQDIANIASNMMRFLVAGQWPDLLPSNVSTELGTLLGHSMAELDSALGTVLTSLKEEGILTPEQSNIDRLRQASRSTLQSLESDLGREDGPIVPPDWNPPGLTVLKEVSVAKFSCKGATAALSVASHALEEKSPVPLNSLYNKLEQCSSQVSALSVRLANVDVKAHDLVTELEPSSEAIRTESSKLLQMVKDLILGDLKDADVCEKQVESVLQHVGKISAILRAASVSASEGEKHHAFSPELSDPWQRVSEVASLMRAIDGDIDDVNYLSRSRQLEQLLSRAVENEPKLEAAESKIATLEKVSFFFFFSEHSPFLRKSLLIVACTFV